MHTMAFMSFLQTYFDLVIKSSFISVLADSEAIADELNPLTISQIPRNISFEIIGRAKIIPALILMPKVSNKFHVNTNMAPMKPQTDIHRGTSFD